MRSALILAIMIMNDANNPSWTDQYDALTSNLIALTIIIFLSIDIYEVITK